MPAAFSLTSLSLPGRLHDNRLDGNQFIIDKFGIHVVKLLKLLDTVDFGLEDGNEEEQTNRVRTKVTALFATATRKGQPKLSSFLVFVDMKHSMNDACF